MIKDVSQMDTYVPLNTHSSLVLVGRATNTLPVAPSQPPLHSSPMLITVTTLGRDHILRVRAGLRLGRTARMGTRMRDTTFYALLAQRPPP